KFGQSKLAVTSQSRPDPDQVFAIELRGKPGSLGKLALAFGAEGQFTGGESLGGEVAASVVVDVLSAVSTIAESLFVVPASEAVLKTKQRKGVDAELVMRPEFDLCYRALERLA